MPTLTANSVYYVRAYAIDNDDQIYYGDQQSFTTIPTLPEWGLIALASMMALIGGGYMWKRV
jgi:hypothetical protein